mgnify:CR=1 FL=1
MSKLETAFSKAMKEQKQQPSNDDQQKNNVDVSKSTQNLSAEDNNPSKEAKKPKESFLEHENPQYLSDISPMISTKKTSQLLRFDHRG